MLTLITGVAAYTVLFTLLVASVGHLRAPRALPSALIAHKVLPRAVATSAAACVIAAEITLAILLLVGLSGTEGAAPVALAASGVLFTCYGGYAFFVVSTGRTGPCGCGGVEVPMDGWVAGRALALAAMALGGAAYREVPRLTAFDPPLLVILLAAATFTTLLWQLPAARHTRDDRRAPQEVVR